MKSIYNLETLELTEKYYLAGLFDGEGGICIVRDTSGRLFLQVKVGMTIEEPIKRLYEVFGGSFCDANQTSSKKPVWVWSTGGRQCKPFLETIGPFLKVKQRHCQLALVFINTINSDDRGKKLPTEVTLQREKIAYLMYEVNT